MLKCCRLKGDPKSDSASEGGLAFADHWKAGFDQDDTSRYTAVMRPADACKSHMNLPAVRMGRMGSLHRFLLCNSQRLIPAFPTPNTIQNDENPVPSLSYLPRHIAATDEGVHSRWRDLACSGGF